MGDSVPRVSVVIPAYNAERYIRRAVDSVQRQIYSDWDLWVVDDGSTDSTARLVDEVRDDHVHCVRRENSGQGAALNTGVRRSGGELLAFLDADDTWHPRHLDRMVAFLDAHPSAGAVGCGLVDGGTGEPVKWRSSDVYNVEFEGVVNYFEAVLERPILHPSAVVIRREIFQVTGGFQEIRGVAGLDLEFWARLAIRCPIGYVGEMLATFHTEATGRFTPKNFNYPPVVYTVSRALELGEIAPSQIAAARRHCQEQILAYVRRLLECGRGSEARRVLRTDPMLVNDRSWESCVRQYVRASYLPPSIFRALLWTRYCFPFTRRWSVIPPVGGRSEK